MRRLAVLVSLAATLALAGGLHAQRRAPAPRDGFWYAIGLAPGWARVSCSICRAERRVGLSAFVRMGGATSRRMRIGAELAAWTERDAGVTQTVTSLGAAAYWYPTPRRPLYLKGGAGLVTHRANDGTNVISSTGVGPQMGIGYEFPVGRSWLAAPFFNTAIGAIGGGVKFNGGQASDDAVVSFFQVGLSLMRR